MRLQQKDFNLLMADIDQACIRAEQHNLDLLVCMLSMAKMELIDKAREQHILSVDNTNQLLLQ